MKDLIRLLIPVCAAGLVFRAAAQSNSWTSPTSGNWQDASWSLGIIPGTNQTVLLTNAGWKAVQIGAATAQNFPQSLNVNSVVISSPTNSFNTLLLNYAGAAHPLTVQTLSVASNSAVTLFSSGLQINGPNGEGMTIGGTFNQNDSVVGGNQINVGYIGPGVYNFNGGYLAVSQLWIGGPGVLNQNGGTNAFGITHLDGGTYVLSNGLYGATAYFDGGEFHQFGGLLQTNLMIFRGGYVLAGGVLDGDVVVPATDGFTSGNGGMLQTGGTNFGSLDIGSYGQGSCTLSNGVSFAESLLVDYEGAYNQWGGTQTVAGTINLAERQIAQNAFGVGSFGLGGGNLYSTGFSIEGYYTQTGGTNRIMGDVTTGGVEAHLRLTNGLFAANNVIANAASEGGIFLEGGTLVVTNNLSIGAYSYFPSWQGFVGDTGQLIASNILVNPGATFSCGASTILESGTLTLANGGLRAGSAPQQFGSLLLGNGGDTNSTICMPPDAGVLQFADSSSLTWSNEALLVIEGWSGSLFGGDKEQIIFGTNASALTTNQLAQIQFHNPAGLAAGTYPAKILLTGEIVPNSGAPLHADLALNVQSNGMQINLRGEAGRSYSIETSTDLVHWVPWTNQVASDGTIHVTDTQTTNAPVRFYRAKLEP